MFLRVVPRSCLGRYGGRGGRGGGALVSARRLCSSASSGSGSGGGVGATGGRKPSINSVTLIGVAHDIQSGYVFEDAVTQFTVTTTSLDTTHADQECVVEKDHHTVRCFGEVFAQDVRARVKEGNIVCVNGRLRLNPQLEPSSNKYYYFPYIQVQPPHGQVSVVYGDRRSPPSPSDAADAGSTEGPATAQ